MVRPALLVAAALLVAGTLSAQAPPNCFRGRPLPACGSFWITEAGYGIRATGNPEPNESGEGGRWLLSLDVGKMKNVSPKLALGGSLSAGTLGGIYIAAKPRVRYWFGRDWSGDFAPGIILTGVTGSPRFTADASLMYQDKIGITTQAFILRRDVYDPTYTTVTSRNRLTVYAGLRLGSKLGLVGAAADAATLIAAIGLYLIACGSSSCD